MKLGRASARMPAVPVSDPSGGNNDGLYTARGPLADEVPDGAVPETPADGIGQG